MQNIDASAKETTVQNCKHTIVHTHTNARKHTHTSTRRPITYSANSSELADKPKKKKKERQEKNTKSIKFYELFFFRWFLLHGFGSRCIRSLFSFFALVFILFSCVCLPVTFFSSLIPSKKILLLLSFYIRSQRIVHIYNGHKYGTSTLTSTHTHTHTVYSNTSANSLLRTYVRWMPVYFTFCRFWRVPMAVLIKRSVIPFAITHFCLWIIILDRCTRYTKQHNTSDFYAHFPRCRVYLK